MFTHTVHAMNQSTAISCANIAFIKYWGNQDNALRIPNNGSLSMNLDGVEARTTVTFDTGLEQNTLTLNGKPAAPQGRLRVSAMLDRVRALSGIDDKAQVTSENNFPMGAGIASSAAAFSALAMAASAAAGLDLNEPDLSRLARTGSGSACRSVPTGFVEWQAGDSHTSSYAFSIAPPDHWDLVDHVAVISEAHKPYGSTQGHALAPTSPLQNARIADADRRLSICREAILQRDFAQFAEIVELDSNLMHAVMMTSTPALLYWEPATLAIMKAVTAWRQAGLAVCCTIDAGPNVHVLCLRNDAEQVRQQVSEIPGVTDILTAVPGQGTRLVLT